MPGEMPRQRDYVQYACGGEAIYHLTAAATIELPGRLNDVKS